MSEVAERVGVVLVVHGAYGEPFVEAAEALVGPLGLELVQVIQGERREQLDRRIRAAIASQDAGQGVLILTDLCGSTPANLGLSIVSQRRDCELLTGLNLAMLMKLATCHEVDSAAVLAELLRGSSTRSTVRGSQIAGAGHGGACGD